MTNEIDRNNMLDDDLNDEELTDLFSAFDEVSASDELREATLARILAADESATDDAPSAEAAPEEKKPAEFKAVEGGKALRKTRRAKWRAIRVAALAACLALALTGGVAYAMPASYYDVTQDGSTVTLGVNCFGITVTATSNDDNGKQVVDSTDLCNRPYEESLSNAIGAMEERNPSAPIEYGPQGEAHETVQPKNDGGNPSPPTGAEHGGNGAAPNENGQPGGEGQPTGEGQPSSAGQPGGESQPGNEGQPSGADQPDGNGQSNGGSGQAPSGGELQDPGAGNGADAPNGSSQLSSEAAFSPNNGTGQPNGGNR